MSSLAIKLEEYWNEIRYRKTKENPHSTVPVEDTMSVQLAVRGIMHSARIFV